MGIKPGEYQECLLTQGHIWEIWSKLPLLNAISFIKATLWLEIKVYILDNSQQRFTFYVTSLKKKRQNCCISLKISYRNYQIIAETWQAKLEMYFPGEL